MLQFAIENIPELSESDSENIKTILTEKFSIIAAELQKVMKIASKGERKGKLIFKPEASRLIYSIDDKFVQYVVRAIYDHFNDIRNGTYHMHCNELFNGDFVKVVFRKLNSFIDKLETEYTRMREDHLHNTELSTIHDTLHKKYELFLSERRNLNVFNTSNPFSKPFFDKYNQLKKNVKFLHPRVPDDKMDAYIEKDYSFRIERTKLENEHLKTFQEYNNLVSRRDEIYEIQRNNENVLSIKMKEEYAKMDYSKISRAIQKMVDQFIGVVVNTMFQ